MSRDIHVFTHNDLDGVGSLLAIIWAFPDYNITYTCVSSSHTFRQDFEDFAKYKKIDSFYKVFVTDLSLNKLDIELIDRTNVIFIDHHKTSLDLTFKNAKSFIKVYTSCVLFIYKLFKTQANLTTNQKQLLIYIDDYDSYQLKFNTSSILNKLYWAHYLHNVPLFLNDFIDGISTFSPLQQQAINIQDKKIKDTIDSLSLFETTTTIQGSSRHIIAAFADTAINDVSDYILHNHNADVVIIVNLKTERVSFRRNKNTIVDVSLLAQNLCEGGGHEAASGGKLTEKFMAFTKLLTPI